MKMFRIVPIVIISSIFVTALAVESSSEAHYVGGWSRKFETSNKTYLKRQLDILDLFTNIYQENLDGDYKKWDNYSIPDDSEIDSSYDWKNGGREKEGVLDFFWAYKRGEFLKRGDIFSIFREDHLEQAMKLCRLLGTSKSTDEVFKIAAWALTHLNEGLFIYAFSTVLAHANGMDAYIIPPIYEINPYYFFSAETIQQAQNYKQMYSNVARRQNSKNAEPVQFTFTRDFSNEQPRGSDEGVLAYFLEDIGNSAFYWYCSVYYPSWMLRFAHREDHGSVREWLKNDRTGEQYYYLYQQFLARYNLERLANNLGEVKALDFASDRPLKPRFYPSLRYPNGMAFPQRSSDATLSHSTLTGSLYTTVMDMERKIRDYIDDLPPVSFVDLYHGLDPRINQIGDLIENNNSSATGPRYLDVLLSRLLGQNDKDLPSALEHYETALRDPLFYRLYKRILTIFERYKATLPPYTKARMTFSHVTVEKIEFDRLETYFDYFDVDLTNAVYFHPSENRDLFRAQVRQKRLNHKPFNYSISLNCTHTDPVESIVRVYLGPKYDQHGRIVHDMNKIRKNFVEIDTFKQNLQPGANVIERSSEQLYWYIPDRTSSKELYRKVKSALESENGEPLRLDASEAFYGLPSRLLLPKGRPEGLKLQVYVLVSLPDYQGPDGEKPKQTNYPEELQRPFYFHKIGSGQNSFDFLPFGFPFDRDIKYRAEFDVPNGKFQEVVIYHTDEEPQKTY